MIDRYQPQPPDERVEQIDAQLIEMLAPGDAESLVAGRVFEESRRHLVRAGEAKRPKLRLVDEDGPSMLPQRSWSAWPIMASLAAMVLLATVIALLYSVQATRNNVVEQVADNTASQQEYTAIDNDFDSEFSVATSTLMSDISASVDSLVSRGDEWTYGSLASDLQSATSNLWTDMDSF